MHEKTYIFVTHTVSGVGGGQRYVLSKSKWLKGEGFDVLICHVEQGPLVLDFEPDELISKVEFRAAPSILGSRATEAVLDEIATRVELGSSCFVESSAPYLSMWGELIAERFFGSHLCFALEESIVNLSKRELVYLRYKLDRNEFAAISGRVLLNLFGNENIDIDECERHVLTAYSGSPVEDVTSDIVLPKASWIIGTVSRLEKPYIARMLEDVVSFCGAYRDKDFLLVLVGDSNDSVKKRILLEAKKAPNLNVVITGYLSPIPLSLISSFDVGIGKAASAGIIARANVPTICYSLEDDEVMGFLEYDVGSYAGGTGQRASRTIVPLLEEAFLGELRLRRKKFKLPFRRKADYSSHFEYLKVDGKIREYYDILNVRPSLKRRLVSYWVKIFHNLHYEKFLVR